MSHEIEKNDVVLTTGNERAWHGLDKNLPDGADLDDVLKIVFPWEPVYVPMGFTDPVTGLATIADHRAVLSCPREIFELSHEETVKLNTETAETETIRTFSAKRFRGLVGNNYADLASKVTKIGEVGPSYKPLYNADLVNVLRPLVETGLTKVDTAGSIFGNRKVWISLKLVEYEPIPGDVRIAYLCAINAHDSSVSPGFVLTEVRVVCNNTFRLMLTSKLEGELRKLTTRHSSNVVQNMETLASTIDLVNARFIVHKEQLQNLAKITIESEEQIRKIARIVNGSDLAKETRNEDRIVELFETSAGNDMIGVRGTGLALHEAFTFWLSHEAGRSQDSRDNKNMFLADNARFMDRVDSSILALA